MVRRTLRGLVQLLGGLGAGLAIIMALAAWRLSSGPISLDFMTPYIQEALSEVHPEFRIELDNTILTWGGWQRALDIRVLNVRAIDPLETTIAAVPQLSVSLSARALLRGSIAPRRIELFYPTVRLLRLRDGRFQVAFGGDTAREADLIPRFLAQLMADPSPDHAMSYLNRVDVIDADLTVEDQMLETSWRAPSAQLHLRKDALGIHGELTLDLDVEGQKAQVVALGDYRHDDSALDLGLEFAGVRPALFSRLSPVLEPFAGLDIPLQGAATATIGGAGGIESAAFDLSGDAGALVLPAPVAQRLDVRKLSLKGRIDGSDGVIHVEDLAVSFPEGTRLTLPDPADHAMPIKALRAAGSYGAAEGAVDISRLILDLAGPRFSLEGKARGLGTGGVASVEARGVLEGVPVDQVAGYWPKGWGADAYAWCTAHLSHGQMTRAEMTASLHLTGGGEVTDLDIKGEMDLDGVQVDYLPPMPAATGVGGRAVFDEERFDIYLDHGQVGDLALRKGSVFLGGLQEYDQTADIELFIDGPLPSALNLIEHEPLGFASAVGLDPERTGGWASTRLKLDFLLEKDLTVDRVGVTAETTLRDAYIAQAVLGRDLTEGNMALKVDKRGMDVTGDIHLAGIPSQLEWRRNFGQKAPIVSHYELSSRIDDVRNMGDLGVELGPIAGDIVSGAANTRITFTDFRGGRSRLKAEADLAELSVDLPMIGWAKSAGTGGTVEAGLSIENGVVVDLDYFSIKASDLNISGSARYAASGTGLERVDFSQISYGRTDMKGAVIPNQDGSWTVSMHGASFDIGPLFEHLFKDPGTSDDGVGSDLRFALSVDLDNLWLGEAERVRNVVGTLSRADDRWRLVRIEGITGADKPFHIHILPKTEGERGVDIEAADAGAMLKALGFYDNMQGGNLKIAGRFDDTRAGSPLDGVLTVTQFRIINAPTLAHLVSLAAITGILDRLQGEGLGFLRLEAPFNLHDGVLTITDAKSSGVSLGFTASGKVYTAAEVMELEGTVVPAYAINAVWGEIPILGEILTGGEKGGGVFAARYKMTGSLESPDISVDPLSALAPGILRNLFGVFDREETEGVVPGAEEGGMPKEEASPAEPVGEQGAVGGL